MADRSRSHARVDSRAESAVAGGVMFVTDFSGARTERAIRRLERSRRNVSRRTLGAWVGGCPIALPATINQQSTIMHACSLQCSGLEPVVVVPNADIRMLETFQRFPDHPLSIHVYLGAIE